MVQGGRKAGTYSGQCAELCGRNHANMYAEVVALPFEEWRQWYDDEAQEIADAKEYAAQERERLEQAEGEDATQGTSGASNTNSNPAE